MAFDYVPLGEAMLTLTAVYVFFVIFVAGILQTVTGFGFALAAAPLLACAINAKEVVVIVLIIGILMKGFIVYKTWGEGDFARIMPLFAASLLGALPGAYVLSVIDESTLKIVIGITLIVATIAMSANVKFSTAHHWLGKLVAGLLSGLLGATTSLSGPPVVLYMMNEGTDKVTMRADLTRYFILGNTATVIMIYLMGGVVAQSIGIYALVSIPAIVLSWWLGERLFRAVNAVRFRYIALAVISVSALITLGSGLWPLVHKASL